MCLRVCVVCRGLGWTGQDLAILGRCKRMKLCNVMVSASQVMGECSTVLWFDLASLQMTGERGGEGKEDIYIFFIIIYYFFCKKLCVCVCSWRPRPKD